MKLKARTGMKRIPFGKATATPARYTAAEMVERDKLIKQFLQKHKIKKCPPMPHPD